MEDQFLYLTTKGWRTGKKHQVEIWFVKHGEKYYIVSETGERSHWVQNIKHNPTVAFRVGEKSLMGSVRALDKAEPELLATVKKLMESKYKWSDGLIVELTPDTS